ncbi:MAG: ABC transporter permease subunit [Chloroflexota bacterium]|nr:MAG: ABC transporter permease subunit [Chloroflexota bacterium]
MDQADAVRPASGSRRGRRRGLTALALAPFALVVLFFLALPAVSLLWGSLHDPTTGALTAANYSYLSGEDKSLKPFVNSLELSFATMLSGGILGLIVAQALVSTRDRVVELLVSSFSSVAANFAGVPLAFAFIATLGVNGLLTKVLLAGGADLYGHGFTLYDIVGLSVVYTYFQLPLMVLLILPALQALKTEWREASENLGAGGVTYLRRVALPVLTPAILGAMLLLFANSFGAYATAYALTTGFIALVPLTIGSVIYGDVTFDPGQADALAMGMAVVMAVCLGLQAVLQRRASRWLRS